MKKLLGIFAILTLLAIPVGLYAQVEAGAGAIKLGVHIDTGYRYSAESNNNPDSNDVYWQGYETFNVENVILGLSGKVGDKVTWKINEALVLGTSGTATLLDANVEWKPIDQVGIIVGRQLLPTALANAPHMIKILHLNQAPLMITGGYNAPLLIAKGTAIPLMIPLPSWQTGAGLDINFSGVNLTYTYYNGELQGLNSLAGGNDMLTEADKEKGGIVSLGYNGEVGPGKLMARAYYFGESSDINGDEPDSSDLAGWGLGALYNADKFFLGAEYVNKTWTPQDQIQDALDQDNVNQFGWYGLVGGRFSSLEVVYRYDFIDYQNIDSDAARDIDTEQWHTIGVNYLINDNTTLGMNYVWKIPEEPDGVDYPNINEFSIMMELDML